MNLLIVVSDLTSKGGVVRSIVNMANAISSKENYEITLLSVFKPYNNEIFYVPYENIKTKYLNLDLNFKGNRIQKQLYFYKNLRNVARNYDCIISTNAHFNIYFAIMKKFKLKAKVLGSEHGSYNHLSKGWRILTKLTYRYLDTLILLTGKELKEYKKFAKNIAIIYNINNITKIGLEDIKSHEEKRILMVGRIDENKNYQDMIRAFSTLSKKYQDWHLDIVGDGEKNDMEKLQILIGELKLKDRVHLLGAYRNIEQFYKRAAIFVMTSKSEGLPMVLIEAISYGIPCVSYDIKTGPSDIIEDSKNGFLINYNEKRIENLQKKIEILMNDEALRKSMSNYAYKTSSKFDEEKIIPQWLEIIGENND